MATKQAGPITRARLEALVWTSTHRDYRGVSNGIRCVLHLVPNVGTCSVSLSSLTEAELISKLPSRVRRERGLE